MTAMQTTRARKEKFIRSFGNAAARDAVIAMFERYGLEILSDDLLEEATSDLAAEVMAGTKRVVRNRRIIRREAGLDTAAASTEVAK